MGEPNPAGTNPAGWDTSQFLIAEYNNLRAEIVKLVELQFQLVALTVVALGTVLSVGFETRNAAIILVQPLLALILGLSWLHHTFRIHRIAAYIRSELEQKVGLHLLGWEHYVQSHPLAPGRLSYWGLRAAFIASSVLAVAASLPIARFGVSTAILLGVAVAATVTTIGCTRTSTGAPCPSRRTAGPADGTGWSPRRDRGRPRAAGTGGRILGERPRQDSNLRPSA